MKSKIYLLVILILFLAFKGVKQKNTTSEPLGTVELTNEIDPEMVVVKTVNIKDIFLLLPENVFPKVPITVAQRKELLAAFMRDETPYEIYSFPIDVCDVKNGYLRLAMQCTWELTYWNLKDGRNLAIVYDINERNDCTINYFFYENGKLTQDHNYRLDKDQDYTLSNFIDVSQLSSDARNFKEKQFEQLLYSANEIAETNVETAFARAFESAVATPVNIKDIFLLLPKDVFEMGISLANRKLLLKSIGEDKAQDISPTPIDVCDVKNGYLSLTGMTMGWEMCYWNMKDGRKLVATNNIDEDGSEIRIFFYQNRKLTEDPSYQLGGDQNFKLTDFIDVSQLSPDIQKLAEEKFSQGIYYIYKLPQKGTSLTVSLDYYQLMSYDEANKIPEEVTKEVTLKWKNEKWER